MATKPDASPRDTRAEGCVSPLRCKTRQRAKATPAIGDARTQAVAATARNTRQSTSCGPASAKACPGNRSAPVARTRPGRQSAALPANTNLIRDTFSRRRRGSTAFVIGYASTAICREHASKADFEEDLEQVRRPDRAIILMAASLPASEAHSRTGPWPAATRRAEERVLD